MCLMTAEGIPQIKISKLVGIATIAFSTLNIPDLLVQLTWVNPQLVNVTQELF